MTIEQLIIDATSLPVLDRLRVAEAIWDSLPGNAVPTASPDVKPEFERRMENYRLNPDTGMTLDQLRDRLESGVKE